VPGPYRREELRKKYQFEDLRLARNVKHGVHILSMDETRDSYAPLLWEGRANEGQTMEQVWMPGVHADIGGGYHESFLSTVSLLWMIDRLAYHCPDLSFDDEYIDETYVTNIVGNRNPVVNDEWKKHLWFMCQYLRPFIKSHRTVPKGNDHNDRHHPMTELINDVDIEIRGRRKPYAPTVYLPEGTERLAAADFDPGSLYALKIQPILIGRFQKVR
jgi:hypothetical protein